MSKVLGLLERLIGNPAEGVVNSLLSLVKDKTRDPETSFIREKVKKGISISTKRVVNLTVVSVCCYLAIEEYTYTLSVTNDVLWLLGIAAVSNPLTGIVNWLKERG